MKRIIILALLIISVAMSIASSASAFDFDDIQIWAGTGVNRAAMVIDWNDDKSPVSLAWGFKWDGVALGVDMLNAIAAVDTRLYVVESEPNSWGVSAYGIGYDLDNDGFATSPALTFTDGVAVPDDANDSRVAADSADHYVEGWWSAGYWSYYVKSGSSASWAGSGVGMSGRTLTDGCWDGWSFAPAPTWDGGAPGTPVAAPVPEPGSFLALASGLISLGGLAIHRRIS